MTRPAGVVQTPTPADISQATELARRHNDHLRTMIRELTGWDVWHSSDGSLYATRLTRLTKAEVERDLAQTVVADEPLDLVEKIREQLRLAHRIAGQAALPQDQ